MSNHRFKLYFPISLFAFIAMVLLILLPLGISGWLYSLLLFVGVFVFVCAIVFDMPYDYSNLLLVLSSLILSGTITWLSISVPVFGVEGIPTYLILVLPLTFPLFMKHMQQMAIFDGLIIVGLMFAASYLTGSLLAFVIGCVSGFVATIVILMFEGIESWNAQVGSVIIFIFIIVVACTVSWVLQPSLDPFLSVGLPLPTMLGVGSFIAGLITSES